MKRTISGKKFAQGEVNDVVFEWDDTVIIPLIPMEPTSKEGNIQGQKIDLHHLSQNDTGPVRTAQRSVTTMAKKPSGPEPKKNSSPLKEKKVTPRGKDIAHPMHHISGSTIPHMRAGSARTRKAASWLADQQKEKRKAHEDRLKSREAVRQREQDRRRKLLSAACAKEDTDMQRVQEGKEPVHNMHMLRMMSLQRKITVGGGPHGSVSVADGPFYSTSGGRHNANTGSAGSSHALTRPAVPRLSKVIVRRSRSRASGHAGDPPVEALDGPGGFESDDVDAPPPPAPDLLTSYATSKGALLPADLPSPGVDIRLRDTFLSDPSAHDGLADEAIFARPGEDDDKYDDYGEDSDFDGRDEGEGRGEDSGGGAVPAEGGIKRVFNQSDDEGGSVGDFGAGRSVGNASGNTADSARLKRRNRGRLYLEQRRKHELAELHRKRKAKEKEDSEKKERLERLDATRKSMLKSAGKLKSIPVHTSTERIPKRPAPTVLQPPVPDKSRYTETDGCHHAVGVSVYGMDRSPKCDIPFRDQEGGVGTRISDAYGGELDRAVIVDMSLESPLTAGVSLDRPPSRCQRQLGSHSESPPRFRERSEHTETAMAALKPDRYCDQRHYDDTGRKDSFLIERTVRPRIRQQRPRSACAHTTARLERYAGPAAVGRRRERSCSAENMRPQQQTGSRPFRTGSTTIAHDSSAGRSQGTGWMQHKDEAMSQAFKESRHQRRHELRKPEIPHHVFSSGGRAKHRSSRDRKSESDKENREQSLQRRGTGRGKAVEFQKKHRHGREFGDKNALLADLLNDPRDMASWHARQQHSLHPIRQTDDNELLECVKSIMENRFQADESSQSKAATYTGHVVKAGAVLAQVDRNETAATQLLKSMERLRNEVAGYSENIRHFAYVRESTGELEMLRASIQSRLSLAASVDSDQPGKPSSPPHDGVNTDGDSGDRWAEGRMDMVRFDDMSPEDGDGGRCLDRSSSSDGVDSEDSYNMGLQQYRRPEVVDEFCTHEGRPTVYKSTELHQLRLRPHPCPSADDMGYGDSMMQQQMGLLQDKRDILVQYMSDTDDEIDHPNDFTSSGDELVWGGLAYKIEKVGGLERLVKATMSSGENLSQSSVVSPAVGPLSLRNVGEITGVVSTRGTSGSIGPDGSEYSDSEASNNDAGTRGDDNQIVSIFANEIYQQRVEEALQLEQEEARGQLLEETYQRTDSEIQKQHMESLVHAKDEPSMHASPAEATPRSADGSAGFDDRSISPRTYWDMMISRSALPSSNGKDLPVLERRETVATAKSSDTDDANVPWTVTDVSVRDRETSFLRAARARETTSQAVHQAVQHVDKEVSGLARNKEQHAYELSLANTTAETTLAVHREMAATGNEVNGGMEQMPAHVDEQVRAVQNQASAGSETAAALPSVIAQAVDMTAHLRVSTGTMTDDNGIVIASISQPSQPELDVTQQHAPVTAGRTSDSNLHSGDDNDMEEYSASFDDDSGVFHRSPAPSAIIPFNDTWTGRDQASKVNGCVEGGEGVDSSEYTFVEESNALASPVQHDQSTGAASESMLVVNICTTDVQDNSEDFGSRTALSTASKSVPTMTPAAAGKLLIPTAAVPPNNVLSQTGTDLFAQYLAEIDNRVRSQEKSIAIRLQLEKKKLEHEQHLLKTAQLSVKTALSKTEYVDALSFIENDYKANVAELERERWTMNARAYKERKKYEQLRRDIDIAFKETDTRGILSNAVPGDGATDLSRSVPPEVRSTSDSSIESAGRSRVAAPAASPMHRDRCGQQQRQMGLNVSEPIGGQTQLVDEVFRLSEHNQGFPSQQLSCLQDEFEELDESATKVGADEYSSDLLEALSTVEGPGINSFKGSNHPMPLSTSTGSPPKLLSSNTTANPVSPTPTNEEASDVPTLAELQHRSRLLQAKRAEAADVMRQRTEEIERRKELIRIEEEEREVERLLQQAKRLDVERELADHRKAARLEARKNVRMAYSDVTAKQLKVDRMHPPAGTGPSKHLPTAVHEQGWKPSSQSDITHRPTRLQEHDSDKADEEGECTMDEDRDELSVNTEVGDESSHENDIPDIIHEVSEVVDDDVHEDKVYDDRDHVPSAASNFHLAAVSYADDFKEVQSVAMTAKLIQVSRKTSSDFLSNLESTGGLDRCGGEEQSRSHRMTHQRSQSSDTFALLDESLERRSERINALKQKIEKVQTSHKLETLRAKQAERKRLQKEEAELIAHLQSEDTAYRMEKERILKGVSNEEPAADDVIVNGLINKQHDPEEAELRVLDDDEALADDSLSLQLSEGKVLESTVEGQVALRVREIEAATKIQAMEGARNAKKIAEGVHINIAAYSAKGDLIEGNEHAKVTQELDKEDSLGSNSSEFSTERVMSPEKVALTEKKAEQITNPASAEIISIDACSHDSNVTPEDALGKTSAITDSVPPAHTPPGLTVELPDLRSSARPDPAFSPLTDTPTAQLHTMISPPPHDDQAGHMLSEPEIDVEESLDTEIGRGEASLSRSVLSIKEPAIFSLHPTVTQHETTSAAGGDLGESAVSTKQHMLETLEAPCDEDSSLMATVGSMHDQTIETPLTMNILDTNKAFQDNGDIPLPAATPALILKESELNVFVRSPEKPIFLPAAARNVVEVEKVKASSDEGTGATASVEHCGDGDEYYNYDGEFEAAEDTSLLVANTDKVPVSTEDETVEDVEDEVSIGESIDLTDSSRLGYEDSTQSLQLGRNEDELNREECVDWFEVSDEQVEEGDLNRTMDSIGVDVVEDVRYPASKESLSVGSAAPDQSDSVVPAPHQWEMDVLEDRGRGDSAMGANQVLSNAVKIARFVAGRSVQDNHVLANEVTDLLMQRLLTSAMTSAAMTNVLGSSAETTHPKFGPSAEASDEPEFEAPCVGSVTGSLGEVIDEEEYSIDQEHEDEEGDMEIQQQGQRTEQDANDMQTARTRRNSAEVMAEEAEQSERGRQYAEHWDVEADSSFEAFDDDSESAVTVVSTPSVGASASLTSLSALPSLGKVLRNGGDQLPFSTPSVRDSSLDALLGDDDNWNADPDTNWKLSPRFGKPARARESDAFADTAAVKKKESVTEMWGRRKKMYVDELFSAIDTEVMNNLVKDLDNPSFDSQNGLMISEEVYYNIELRRMQKSTADDDVDSDGVSHEVTQMNHKVIFDRVNEVLCELHLLRHSAKGCGPPAPYNRRVVAKCLPLDRAHILPLLKERLFPPLPKQITTTLDDGTTVVQPRSNIDNLKMTTLDSLRDEVQMSLLDTAEYVTDVILARMLVEIANIAVITYSH